MSRPKRRKVTVGLAVYNGQRYLVEAIDSILAQTFTDFELILTDNASTDRTRDICLSYAACDERIRYHRNATNIGMSANLNRAFQLSQSPYFRWMAHDDVLQPRCLEYCVEALERDSEAVAAHGLTGRIDAHGRRIGLYAPEFALADTDPRVRLRFMLYRHHFTSIFALMRSSVLNRTRLIEPYFGADRNLMAEMLLRGRIVIMPEVLLMVRDHPAAASRAPTARERIQRTAPEGRVPPKLLFPLQSWKYVTGILRSPISIYQKGRCLNEVQRYVMLRLIASGLKHVGWHNSPAMKYLELRQTGLAA